MPAGRDAVFRTDGGGVLTNRYMIVFGNGGVGVAVAYGDFEGDGRAALTEREEECVQYGGEVEADIMGTSCRMVGWRRLKGMRGG